MSSGEGGTQNGCDRTRVECSRGGAAAPATPVIDFEELEIVSRIGSGSSADIFSAKLRGQLVAVKVYFGGPRQEATTTTTAAVDDGTAPRQPPTPATSVGLDYRLREIAVLSRLKHHDIVSMVGLSETPKGRTCLVLEYMDRGSLRDEYLRAGPLPPQLVRKTALSIARAMAVLHSQHILHRDLKADNILVDEKMNSKLADFGLSRVKAGKNEDHTFETGSYRWMAPEVLEHEPYGEKADVYSFGILLWELLAGRVPYPNHTPIQAAMGVVRSGLRPPVQIGVPTDLQELMAACWHGKPHKRPSFLDVMRIIQGADLSDTQPRGCFGQGSGSSQRGKKRLSHSVPVMFGISDAGHRPAKIFTNFLSWRGSRADSTRPN